MDDPFSSVASQNNSKAKHPPGDQGGDQGLAELRNLLIGPEKEEINRRLDQLENCRVCADEVSQVLPEAITIGSLRDKKIAKALEPTIDVTIKASVRKDPQSMADALFPVMGPAIRKAISSALLGMTQSLNQLLEHSLSLKGLKWRLEAWRTKRPFAEVVLLHTLIYRVEQVLLVHRESGLLLQHVVAKEVDTEDPDLVSSMLSAIRDFVSDSFGSEEGECLDTLRVGDRCVWIEQGPQAILAAVIRGNPPEDLKTVLGEALDAIHLGQSEALESFQGDTSPFNSTRSYLEDCFQGESRTEEQNKRGFLLWIVLGMALFITGIWAYDSFRDQWRWGQYIERLNAEPGIFVTLREKRAGKHHIFGLKDPLASDPFRLLQEARIEAQEAIFHWEPYHSIHPPFISARIHQILNPPETVTLHFDEGRLSLNGAALHQWIIDAKRVARSFPGVVEIRDDQLVDIDLMLHTPDTVVLKMEGGTLHASGAALHRWIVEARGLVKTIAGIDRYVDRDIINMDLRVLQTMKEKIEHQSIFFGPGETLVSTFQMQRLAEVVIFMEKFFKAADAVMKNGSIEIIGHADSTGAEETNMVFSRQRAVNVFTALVSNGIKADRLTIRAVGSKMPPKRVIEASDGQHHRCVTFRVSTEGKPEQ